MEDKDKEKEIIRLTLEKIVNENIWELYEYFQTYKHNFIFLRKFWDDISDSFTPSIKNPYRGIKINTPLFEIEFLGGEKVPNGNIFRGNDYSGRRYTKVKVKINE